MQVNFRNNRVLKAMGKKESKRRLVILYGSETGTSQDLAEQIWRESKKYNFSGPVMSMDEYDIKRLIEEEIVVFVCSTTGQGNEPQNMKKFWKFLLRKSLPSNSLMDMQFAVLGLGDSSYTQFNYAAKRLHKRLLQLSATSVIPLGLCDDQHDLGPGAVYFNWIRDLWDNLCVIYPDIERNDSVSCNFKYHLQVINEEPSVDMQNLQQPVNENAFQMITKENKRTTKEDHFQDVRLLEFEITEEDVESNKLSWHVGDVLVLKPWNPKEKVENLFAIFAENNFYFNEKTVVKLEQVDREMPLPPCYENALSLKQAATYIWDLNAIPRQRVFELLALNCDDELENEKLIDFTLPTGLEELYDYTSRPKRTILEVLGDFRNAVSKLTLPVLFELFPSIQCRSFSIASSPLVYRQIHILVAVVDYKTRLIERRKGLCSNWLKNLNIGDRIYATTKQGTMKIPQDPDTPIIMVGPGTGVAPFRGLLLDRELSGCTSWQLVLFFGCRSKYKDFHCKDDFMRLQDKGIVKCFYAFSRDQEHKIYVQHLIKENCKLLKKFIIDQNAVILVAGSSKDMPTAVKEAFAEVVGSMEVIDHLVKQKRYQEETWS